MMAPWRAGGWRWWVRRARLRLAARRLPRPLRVPVSRTGEIVFDDPTRNLQLASGLFVLLLGWNALATPALTPHATNVVTYWWASRETWGWLRVGLGIGQMVAASRPRNAWRWKLGVAQAQILLAAYSLTATALTAEPAASPSSIWLLIVESWIAGRALYDRDINGTDRRLREETEKGSHG